MAGFAFSNLLNIKGKLDVNEMFAETLLPLVADRPVADRLSVTVAALWADYSGSGSGSGSGTAWKYGVDLTVNDAVRLRATRSRDVRAATLTERLDRQGSPRNVRDPANNNEQVAARGSVGGNPNLAPEEADTTTIGVGRKRRAPGFVSAIGLEWLFRAACEGRRLRRRYMRVAATIVPLLVKHALPRR